MNYIAAAIGIIGIVGVITLFLAAFFGIVVAADPPMVPLRVMAGLFLVSICGWSIPTVMYLVRVRGTP